MGPQRLQLSSLPHFLREPAPPLAQEGTRLAHTVPVSTLAASPPQAELCCVPPGRLDQGLTLTTCQRSSLVTALCWA